MTMTERQLVRFEECREAYKRLLMAKGEFNSFSPECRRMVEMHVWLTKLPALKRRALLEAVKIWPTSTEHVRKPE